MTETGEKKGNELLADADNQIAGRLASVVAKELMKGKRVFVVNAEKAVLSGEPSYVVKKYSEKVKRGDPYHGPFYPRIPDRMLKRMIRGMIPYKKAKGKDAMKRLKVFISFPEELKNKGPVITEKQNIESKFTTLGDLAVKLGAKRTW